jgi:hypothetical protein
MFKLSDDQRLGLETLNRSLTAPSLKIAESFKALEGVGALAGSKPIADSIKALQGSYVVGDTAKLGESLKALQGITVTGQMPKFADTYRLATDNMRGITEVARQADRLKLDLANIELEPAPLGVDGGLIEREAERDAAILATRDASIELADGIRELAAIEAQVLVQLTNLAAEAERQTEAARSTRKWTLVGVGVAAAVLIVAVATYFHG